MLGRVGKITAEKWKVTDENGQVTYPLKEKGYNMNDVIGISGLESVYEDELRGKDGVETITRNSDGVIVDTALTTVPEPAYRPADHQQRLSAGGDKALANNIDMINRVQHRRYESCRLRCGGAGRKGRQRAGGCKLPQL